MSTPARSEKDVWVSRLSPATRPRSSTTPTGQSSQRRDRDPADAPQLAPAIQRITRRAGRRHVRSPPTALRRGIGGTRPTPAGGALRGDPAQEQTKCCPA